MLHRDGQNARRQTMVNASVMTALLERHALADADDALGAAISALVRARRAVAAGDFFQTLHESLCAQGELISAIVLLNRADEECRSVRAARRASA